MNNFDEIWQNITKDIVFFPSTLDKQAMTDYLNLKNSNDAIRQQNSIKLLGVFREAVSYINRQGFQITEETIEPHSFQMNQAIMSGTLLRFRQGVRCLEVETGWTRTPADGFMRGNALACARILHFGREKANQELVLLKEEGRPQWFSVDAFKTVKPFELSSLQKHFEIFLG